MEETVLLLPDTHVHILIISAKDGVGARLLHPEVELGVPGGGLGCRAHGDGGLCSLQLHLHTIVGVGQHRGVSGGQRELHIQLLPAFFAAVLSPEHQLILLWQKQAQVFQFIVFQRIHPHLRKLSAETQAIVIRALRHLSVKGLHGLPLHLLLHFVRVQPHALQHLGHGELPAAGKIEAPAAVTPRGGAAVAAAHHQTDAVAIPPVIPGHTDQRGFAARLSGLLVGLELPEIRCIDGVQLIVDVGGVRAVAFQLGHMDGNVLHRFLPPHARNVLFQRVLVGDAVCLGGQRRRAGGASAAGGALVGSCAGACGRGGGRCTAAPCQQQGRSQHQRPCAKGPPGTAVFCLLHRVLLSLIPLFFEGGFGLWGVLCTCGLSHLVLSL